jgi:hypothetical protein
MSEDPPRTVEAMDLSRLGVGDNYPALCPNGGIHLAQAAAVCLLDRGHFSGRCRLAMQGVFETSYTLLWPDIDDRVVRQWNDEQEATEQGAVGVSILLITDLTEFQVVLRSRKGTGFDYWLGRKGDVLFQSAARLEVSGIRSGSQRILDGRVRHKMEQTKRSDGSLPAFIAVVEFGTPIAKVVRR